MATIVLFMLLSFTNFKDMTVFLYAYQFTIRTDGNNVYTFVSFSLLLFVLFRPCYFLVFFLIFANEKTQLLIHVRMTVTFCKPDYNM